jgi:hypothetical protein
LPRRIGIQVNVRIAGEDPGDDDAIEGNATGAECLRVCTGDEKRISGKQERVPFVAS